MPMERPTFFTKVLNTLKQLTTTRGFSVRQIADQLQLLIARRNLKEIKLIVEKSLKYGVKQKILLEKSGKFHLSASKLQSFHDGGTASQKKKKKRVRFKKGETIKDVLKKTKTKCVRRNSRKASTKSKRKPAKSKKSQRGRTHNERSDESGETTETQEGSPTAEKSNSVLIEENKETKEPLDVTPERDVHGNCVNKKRVRDKEAKLREPPRLDSESEIGLVSPRPPNKLIQRNQPRRSSRVRKNVNKKYKHHCQHAMERKKRLKDFIPDDKSYRNYKSRSRSRHNCDHGKSGSEYDSKKRRKCHHHHCQCCHQKHQSHQSHQCRQSRRSFDGPGSPDDYLLERKVSNTLLDHLNRSKTVLDRSRTSLDKSQTALDKSQTALDTAEENLTPFEVFLEANYNQLETIAENISAEEAEPVEEVANEATDNFDTSYIN